MRTLMHRATISDAHVLNLTEYGGPWNPLRNNGSSPVEDNGTSHLGWVVAAWAGGATVRPFL